MSLFVLSLVVIDLVILGVYTLVEGLRGNLGVKLTTNRELPEETFGVSYLVFQYENNVRERTCFSLQLKSTTILSTSVNRVDR